MDKANKRPTLLTVICIISFIGLGSAILNALLGIVVGSFLKPMAGIMQSGMDDIVQEITRYNQQIMPFVQSFFYGAQGMVEHIVEISIVNLICGLIALWGVIMMWNLKKIGFYLYAGGKIIIAIFPLIIVGSNLLTGIIAITSMFFAALFILLYGLNLKAMDK